MHDVVEGRSCRRESFLETFHDRNELPPEVSGSNAFVIHVRWGLSGDEDHLAGALDGNDPGEVRMLEDARWIDPFFLRSEDINSRKGKRASQHCTESSSKISIAIAHGDILLRCGQCIRRSQRLTSGS